MIDSNLTRRRFVQMAGAGVSTSILATLLDAAPFQEGAPIMGKLVDPNKKLRIACIGCGGKGRTDIARVATENIVALCDVDPDQAVEVYDKYPDVPKYQDFRKMLDELGDQIDAVTVSTPDHMHYAAGMAAITRGKHVFIQKPLAHSLWEVRELTLAARRHGVVSQMGNQGHAREGVRFAKEWVQADLIGEVKEVHVWTSKLNREKRTKFTARPAAKETIPDSLDWDLWLGTAPARPYSIEYCPYKWRGWWEFGGGALGDIGCHTMDAAFFALDLGAPIAVTAETAPFTDETYPEWSIVTYEFPARGSMPPVKMVWYDGGKVPGRPRELEAERELDINHGYLMYGDRGVIYDSTEKCYSPRIIPEARMQELARSKKLPAKTIPRVPKGDPFQEWIKACKGGPKPGSNFDYAGSLSEMVLLGNVAIRAKGKRIEWDSANLAIRNYPEMNKHVKAPHRGY